MKKPVGNRIGALVLSSGQVDPTSLGEAELRQAQWGGRFTQILLDMQLIEEDALVDLIAQGMRVPRVDLEGITPDALTLSRVDAEHAVANGLFPVALRDGARTLLLAMADPSDLAAADHVARGAGVRVQVAVAGERALARAQARLWPHLVGADDAFGRVQGALHDDAEEVDEEDQTGFKVVDAYGQTVARGIDGLLAMEPPPPPPAATGELERAPDRSHAAALLDDLLGGASPIPEGFTTEQLARLEALRQNQEKSSRILRAILELSAEKGLLQMPELARRMRG
ncbi:MAG TPA: hypothetical protein VK013_06865 [Myxococcaceae bacterium]|nr:hypothetical protein [Myxococcaceae bacterium]